MTRAVGGTLLAVAGTASLAVTAFWPGVACNSNAEVDAARQARERALGRHRLEAISNYIETQRKIERKRKFAEQKKLADERAKSVTPAQRTAFRASAVIGIWQRYVAGPNEERKGKLTRQQAKLAALAVRKLQPRVKALADSARAAKLTAIADSATELVSTLPAMDTAIGDGTVEPDLFEKVNGLIGRIREEGIAAKLPILPKVPADFGSS